MTRTLGRRNAKTLGALAALAALVCVGVVGESHAGVAASIRSRNVDRDGDNPEGPGLYGELGGAASFGLSGGASLLAGGSPGGVAFAPRGGIDFFFISTVGLKAAYATNARDVAAGHTMRQQSASFTLELRPLFLPMFLYDKFSGRERLDLFLYSIGIEVGFSYERSSIAGSFGAVDERLGFHVGVGFEVPLVREKAHALFLRFQVRGNFVPATPLRGELAQLAGRAEQSIDSFEIGVLLRYRFHFWDSL